MGWSWSRFLRQRVEDRWPGTGKHLEKCFDFIPREQREGPWAWPPVVTLGALALLAVVATPGALAEYEPMGDARLETRAFRFVGLTTGVAVLARMLYTTGSWPMLSWTMLGWTTTTVRYFAGVAGLRGLQRALTFPSLMANMITVLVWYAILLPGFMMFTKPQNRLQRFREIVFSPFLMTVHGFNAPFSLLDWYLQPFRLGQFDLWCGAWYTLAYAALYLGVLDPLGMHLYFIISPRKWWGCLVYLLVVGIGAGCWQATNVLHAKL